MLMNGFDQHHSTQNCLSPTIQDHHMLEFHERDTHPIKYKFVPADPIGMPILNVNHPIHPNTPDTRRYQCDPSTLTPEKLGNGDVYLTAFARRPGLKVMGAPGAPAPGFNPAAWDEAAYLVRVWVRRAHASVAFVVYGAADVLMLTCAHTQHRRRRAAASLSVSRPARVASPARSRLRSPPRYESGTCIDPYPHNVD